MERIALEIEPRITLPLLLLVPPRKGDAPLPVVIGVSQHGKQAFLKERPETIAGLLQGGAAVCLPDLRGTGETDPGGGRGRRSDSTSLSATELMLGQTLVGSRLRDLRTVMQYLRGRPELDRARVALWGDSFAPANPADRSPAVPLDAEKLPDQAEPLGGLVAIFGALFEDSVQAVYVHGGLSEYQSALQSPFWYLPHDVVVPGALTVGDLTDVVAALAPRAVRLEGLVDGLNRKVALEAVQRAYAPANAAYQQFTVRDRLQLAEGKEKPGAAAAQWLLGQIKGK